MRIHRSKQNKNVSNCGAIFFGYFCLLVFVYKTALVHMSIVFFLSVCVWYGDNVTTCLRIRMGFHSISYCFKFFFSYSHSVSECNTCIGNDNKIKRRENSPPKKGEEESCAHDGPVNYVYRCRLNIEALLLNFSMQFNRLHQSHEFHKALAKCPLNCLSMVRHLLRIRNECLFLILSLVLWSTQLCYAKQF